MIQDEQTLRRSTAKNIAAYRKAHKDTQLDLARKLNYSDKSVSKWERGEGLPDVYILAQIAQLYGITVSNLIGDGHFNYTTGLEVAGNDANIEDWRVTTASATIVP